MAVGEVQLRAIQLPRDRDWLWAVHRTTMRSYVIDTWGAWDDAGEREFLERSYSPATMRIVVGDGRDLGLCEVQPRPGELYLARFGIVPHWQRAGVGSAVLRLVQAEAQQVRQALCLQVQKVNPARRLYERAGFRLSGETATHWLMRWWAVVG